MIWSTDTDDANMLLGIPFPMNCVIIDQLALNLVAICLDNMLKILCKSLLCYAEIRKIAHSKIPNIWLLKFCMFNFKMVYPAQFLTHFNNLDFDLKILR